VLSYCDFICESLSTFNYKVFKGFILGYLIHYYIDRKYSKLKWDKGENNKNVHNLSIFITVITILLINIVAYVGIGLLPIVYAMMDKM